MLFSLMDSGSFAPGFQFSAVGSRVLTVVRAVARLCRLQRTKQKSRKYLQVPLLPRPLQSLVAAGLWKPSLTLVSALHPLNCV